MNMAEEGSNKQTLTILQRLAVLAIIGVVVTVVLNYI